MLNVRLAADRTVPETLALPVAAADVEIDTTPTGALLSTACAADRAVHEEARAFLADVEHTGRAGVSHTLARPLGTPERILFVGVGAGDEAGWRSAGAAVARSARRDRTAVVAMPPGAEPDAVRGLAEGLWLASYRFRIATDPPDSGPKLTTVTIVADTPARYEAGLDTARVVAEATLLARDLTNTPSVQKSPAWLARRRCGPPRPTPASPRPSASRRGSSPTASAACSRSAAARSGRPGWSNSPGARAAPAPTSCWSERASPSTPAACGSSRGTR